MAQEMKPKVFGLGLPRTGTQSVGAAMRKLGWSTIHYPKNLDEFYRYDAAFDQTVVINASLLHKTFPNCLFIYTRRDWTKWARSLRDHMGDRRPRPGLDRFFCFGNDDLTNPTEMLRRVAEYEALLDQWIAYNDIRDRVCFLNICDKWESPQKLADFLGVENTVGDEWPYVDAHQNAPDLDGMEMVMPGRLGIREGKQPKGDGQELRT